MICRLLAMLVRIDWRTPLTTGGGPALDRALYPTSPRCLPYRQSPKEANRA